MLSSWALLVSYKSRSLAPRGARHRPGRHASPSRQVKAHLSLAALKNRTTPLQPGTGPARNGHRCHFRRCLLSPQSHVIRPPPGGDPSRSPSDPRRCAATRVPLTLVLSRSSSSFRMVLSSFARSFPPVSFPRSHFRAPPSSHSHPKSLLRSHFTSQELSLPGSFTFTELSLPGSFTFTSQELSLPGSRRRAP